MRARTQWVKKEKTGEREGGGGSSEMTRGRGEVSLSKGKSVHSKGYPVVKDEQLVAEFKSQLCLIWLS